MYKFLIPLFALALLIGCSGNADQPTPENPDTPSSSAMVPPTSDDDVPPGFDGELLSGKHVVTLETSEGDVTIELDADKAPKAVTNFVVLAQMGYFDDLTFHRVIPDFMIQGGDPSGDGTGGSSIFGESFEDEQNDLEMVKGVIAMANRGPNTNGSQFFIVTAEATPWLQGRHTIFGHVTEGMDIVDQISQVERDARDAPVKPVTFTVEVQE